MKCQKCTRQIKKGEPLYSICNIDTGEVFAVCEKCWNKEVEIFLNHGKQIDELAGTDKQCQNT